MKQQLNTILCELSESHLPQVHAVAERAFEKVWTLSEFRFFLVSPAKYTIGLLISEKLVAYLLCLVGGTDTADIISIAVEPDLQRNGLAKVLMNHLLEEPWLKEVVLEVNVNNVGAIAFYESLSFTKLGRRPKYYEGRDDAWLMKWQRESSS